MCSVLCVGLVAALIAITGSVSGTEFAPSHFQTRRFSFYEIPFLHLQITPIKRTDNTGPVARQVRAKSWISVPRGTPPSNWHIVSLSRGPSETPAVASLLTTELQLADSNGQFWQQWNTDHPVRAATLWPTVQRLAERELYVVIPELMLLARTLPGDDDQPEFAVTFAATVDQWLIDQYGGLVKDLRDADRTVLADQLLAEALVDFPLAEELTQLQSSSE